MMKRTGLFILAVTLASPFISSAAPLERDLGQGLRLIRLHELPADLPTAAPEKRAAPVVVDIRYVHADDEAAAAFHAWVKARATSRGPVFLLANADTSRDLLKPFTDRQPESRVVVIGVPARRFQPHVTVQMSADDERRAYDALEKGATLASVLVDNPSKVRNDEASLSRDRLAEASADTAADELAPKSDAPPVDATLQRAVHLHRTLVALRRL